MGCFSISSSYGTRDLPNPDPRNFIIKDIEQRGLVSIVTVNYPKCTNYEGNKILIMVGLRREQILRLKFLDPHFTDVSPIIARFVPSKLGMDLARRFVQSIVNDDDKGDESTKQKETK